MSVKETASVKSPDDVVDVLERRFGFETGSLDVQRFVNIFSSSINRPIEPGTSAYRAFKLTFERFAEARRRTATPNIYADFEVFSSDPLNLPDAWLRFKLVDEYRALGESLMRSGNRELATRVNRIYEYLDYSKIKVDPRLSRSLHMIYVLSGYFSYSAAVMSLMKLVSPTWDRRTGQMVFDIPRGFHRLVADLYNKVVALDPKSTLMDVQSRRDKIYILLSSGRIDDVRKLLPIFELNEWRPWQIADRTLEAAIRTPIDDTASNALVSEMIGIAGEISHMIEDSRSYISEKWSPYDRAVELAGQAAVMEYLGGVGGEFGSVFEELADAGHAEAMAIGHLLGIEAQFDSEGHPKMVIPPARHSLLAALNRRFNKAHSSWLKATKVYRTKVGHGEGGNGSTPPLPSMPSSSTPTPGNGFDVPSAVPREEFVNTSEVLESSDPVVNAQSSVGSRGRPRVGSGTRSGRGPVRRSLPCMRATLLGARTLMGRRTPLMGAGFAVRAWH